MNNETATTQSSADILFESDITYEYDTRGQRFLNYLIDNIVMRIGLTFLTGMVMGVLLQAISPDFLERMVIVGTGEY